MNLLEVNVTQNMSFIERVKEITERLMEDLEHNSFSGVEVLRELSKVSEEKEVLMPIVFTGVLMALQVLLNMVLVIPRKYGLIVR